MTLSTLLLSLTLALSLQAKAESMPSQNLALQALLSQSSQAKVTKGPYRGKSIAYVLAMFMPKVFSPSGDATYISTEFDQECAPVKNGLKQCTLKIERSTKRVLSRDVGNQEDRISATDSSITTLSYQLLNGKVQANIESSISGF